MDSYKITNKEGVEEIIYIPYNPSNILVTERDILDILNKFDINITIINDMEVFIQAFTHKSYCKNEIYNQMLLNNIKKTPNVLELFDKSYERLEYLGDRLLKTVMGTYLYHRYETQNEGYMTRIQIKIEDKKNLALMAKELGLNKFLIINKKIENDCGRDSDKLCEDIFESFIGALYLCNGIEEGFKLCTILVTNMLETLIDYSNKLYCDNNYKDTLMRVYHHFKWDSPKYDVIYYEGNTQNRLYIMGVYSGEDSNKYIGIGISGTKKNGEQNAAKIALIKLNELNNDQYTKSDLFLLHKYKEFYSISSNILKDWFINYEKVHTYVKEFNKLPAVDNIVSECKLIKNIEIWYDKCNSSFKRSHGLLAKTLLRDKWKILLNNYRVYLPNNSDTIELLKIVDE